jgi:hypothetical protein
MQNLTSQTGSRKSCNQAVQLHPAAAEYVKEFFLFKAANALRGIMTCIYGH